MKNNNDKNWVDVIHSVLDITQNYIAIAAFLLVSAMLSFGKNGYVGCAIFSMVGFFVLFLFIDRVIKIIEPIKNKPKEYRKGVVYLCVFYFVFFIAIVFLAFEMRAILSIAFK